MTLGFPNPERFLPQGCRPGHVRYGYEKGLRREVANGDPTCRITTQEVSLEGLQIHCQKSLRRLRYASRHNLQRGVGKDIRFVHRLMKRAGMNYMLE